MAGFCFVFLEFSLAQLRHACSRSCLLKWCLPCGVGHGQRDGRSCTRDEQEPAFAECLVYTVTHICGSWKFPLTSPCSRSSMFIPILEI